MKAKTVYEAFDGKLFDSAFECQTYEQKAKNKSIEQEVTITATLKIEGLRVKVKAPVAAADNQIVEKVHNEYDADDIIDLYCDNLNAKAILWHVKIE